MRHRKERDIALDMIREGRKVYQIVGITGLSRDKVEELRDAYLAKVAQDLQGSKALSMHDRRAIRGMLRAGVSPERIAEVFEVKIGKVKKLA